MVKIELNLTRRHLYSLIATVAVFALIVPTAGWAADKFKDVPNTSVFHDDIAWLAGAGVTKGCNPPANDEFCPGDNVRRETMAAFMHRLAVNQVVDAGTLQGKTAAELSGPIAVAAAGDGIYTEDWNWDDPYGKTEVISVSLDVPSGGIVVATGFAQIRHGHGEGTRDLYVVDITDDLDSFDPLGGATIHDAAQWPSGYVYNTITPHRVFEVAEGSHTFTLVAANLDKVLEGDVRDVTLSAVFYPTVGG